MEKKTVELNVKAKEALTELTKLGKAFEEDYKNAENLSAELGALEDALYELAIAGKQGGAEFQSLASEVARMKKVIVDVDMAVDGMSGTMSQKLGGSIQGLAGGFELAQGVMGAFGVESAKVEEALLKVNSAMAIAQGVQSVRESIPAFKALNAVLMSNPIGLIVTAFIALSAAAMYFASKANTEVIDAFNKSKEASEKYRKQLEKTAQQQNKINDKILKDLDREAARRIAMGEDASKVQKQINAEKIKTLEISLEQDKAEVRILNSEKEKLKATQKQTKEKLQQQVIAAKQAVDDNVLGIEVIRLYNIKKIADALEQIKEIDKETEKQLQATNAQLTARNQEIEASEDAINDLKTAQISLNTEAKKGNDEAAKKRKEELDAIAEVNAGKLALETTFLKTKRAIAIENNAIDLDVLKTQADAENKIKEAKRKEDAEKAKAAKKAQLDAELNMAKTALSTLGEIADLFAGKDEASQKKAFNVKKAAAIATTTIETYQAAQSAYASQMAIPTPDAPIRAAIAAGIAIAQGLVRVASISKTKFQGGGGGASGGGGGGGGSVPSPSTPANFNIVGNSNTNQLMEGLNNNPVKTYVVSGDVTSAQSLDRNQIKTATL